jgi:hypothetical protein
MVEYTIVLVFGVLVLVSGPGRDVILDLMEVIRNNYDGYSYAMSLSEWPEFEIDHDGPMGGADPTAPNVPASGPEDWLWLSYHDWLTDNGVSDERADYLAGPTVADAINAVQDFLEGQIPILDGFPDGLPPDIGDIVEGFLPF